MFVRTFAGAVAGIDAVAVTVEVNIAGGGLGMYLVGLPDNAVKESEQRIRAAFENSGERMSGKKVVVSLAPADLRKEGAGFDLPIAVGILAAMGRIDAGAVAGTMVPGAGSGRGALLVMSLGTGLILVPAFMTAVVVAGHQGPGHHAHVVGMIRDHGHPVSDMLRGLSFIRKSERGHTGQGQGQGRQQQTKVLCAHGKTPCESGATRCGQLCPTFPA